MYENFCLWSTHVQSLQLGTDREDLLSETLHRLETPDKKSSIGKKFLSKPEDLLVPDWWSGYGVARQAPADVLRQCWVVSCWNIWHWQHCTPHTLHHSALLSPFLPTQYTGVPVVRHTHLASNTNIPHGQKQRQEVKDTKPDLVIVVRTTPVWRGRRLDDVRDNA